MMKAVVDTNVAVVANGKSSQAPPACIAACARRLLDLTQGGRLVLDDGWFIVREYMQNLRESGQPGSGNTFLKWVLTNHRNPERCELVRITPKDEGATDFEEFPGAPGLANFHGKDRKFVAVAIAHPDRPPILQAVDAEWWDVREDLKNVGVTVDFLCPDDIRAMSRRER